MHRSGRRAHPEVLRIFATEKYALHTAGPLRVFYRVTYPIMVIFNGITNGVMRLFGHDPADEHEVYTGEEIKLLIDESTESGLIDPEQNEFVDNIFDLGDKDAEGIMTRAPTSSASIWKTPWKRTGTSCASTSTRATRCATARRTASSASCTPRTSWTCPRTRP